MKNRLFPIIIGLCFVSLIGLAFLRSTRPPAEAPIKTEAVQESVKLTDMSPTEDVTPSDETEATSQASLPLPNIDNIDMDEYKAALRSKDIERMKKALGPDMAARLDAGMKFMEEKMEGSEEGEFPDFNLQEFLNVIIGEDEDGPKFDLTEISQKAFREHFPEGEPADYEQEMAERIHEIVANTPGDFQKVMMGVTMDLAKEQDFQFWALAHFKGEIGQQMQWMTDQILVAGELENIQYTVPEDVSTLLPTLTGSATQGTVTPPSKPQATASATESIAPSSVRPNENGEAATANSQTELPSPMSVERIKSIRDLLSQDGPDAGLLQLLETDKEAANYLLERFNSPTEITEWLSKQSTEDPRSKPNSQPLPPEVQP